MKFTLPIALSATITLAACAPQTDAYYTGGPTVPPVTCNAAEFDYLKGQPIESVATVVTPLTVRVLGATEFVPKDYDANRLTFTTAPNGTV
ncbi:MAG: hypothetical protein JNK88_08740, partial [Mangrovicoccus sp.]|nr:hypothetical protein [Mangrovicoccus sp.]